MKKAISLLLALAMCLSLCACFNRRSKEYDKWPTSGLGAVLPTPDTEKVEVFDYSSFFSATVYIDETTSELFPAYVAKCESAGFSVDAEKNSDKYVAYNKEGYRVSMQLFDGLGQFDIHLDTPKVNGTFAWPSIGLATLLPEPKTNVGTVEYDTSKQFSVWIGETSLDSYKEYVNECIDSGFSVDYDSAEKNYSAKNIDGVSLKLEYQGFDTMYISMRAPSDDSENNSESTEELLQSDVMESTAESEDDIKLEDISYSWSQGVLAEEVPLPDATETTMVFDGNDSFNVKIYGDLSAFQKYVDRCKKRGYTCEAKDSSITYYSAYRADGTRIEIQFIEEEGLYQLFVRESWIKDPLTWPEVGLATMVPTPKGSKGKIIGDSSVYFSAYVGEMTEKDYLNYVEECRKRGFVLDEVSWDGYFSAYHESDNGDAVTIQYRGVDTIQVEIFTGQKR